MMIFHTLSLLGIEEVQAEYIIKENATPHHHSQDDKYQKRGLPSPVKVIMTISRVCYNGTEVGCFSLQAIENHAPQLFDFWKRNCAQLSATFRCSH
jgi:hypothetical protein